MLYQLNRGSAIREQFDADSAGLLKTFDLTHEEIEAIKAPDLGLLYVMGVNGQILVSYAALRGFAWPDYIAALQDGWNDSALFERVSMRRRGLVLFRSKCRRMRREPSIYSY